MSEKQLLVSGARNGCAYCDIDFFLWYTFCFSYPHVGYRFRLIWDRRLRNWKKNVFVPPAQPLKNLKSKASVVSFEINFLYCKQPTQLLKTVFPREHKTFDFEHNFTTTDEYFNKYIVHVLITYFTTAKQPITSLTFPSWASQA